MSRNRIFTGLVGCVATVLTCSPSMAETLVGENAQWKYLHPTDGTDPAESNEQFHSTFYTLEFDDSQWQRGEMKPGPNGGFGYGDDDYEGIEIGRPESRDRRTAYFRHVFDTEQPHGDLVVHLQRDDGAIIYLDGEEVARSNMPRGDEAYDLFAEDTISGSAEREVHKISLDMELEPGKHILAISLHNRQGGSSDLRLAQVQLTAGGEDSDDETDNEN